MKRRKQQKQTGKRGRAAVATQQRNAVALLAEGKTQQEIARRLGLHPALQ